MTIRIQPSILSADFVNFERDFQSISEADGIHVDVMDGHFVPNMTFGLPMVKRMQEITSLPLDVHLMIDNPDEQAVRYAELGVFSVTVHFEACIDAAEVAKQIRGKGSRAGLSIKPNTSVSEIEKLIEHFDQILVMSVEPGFGGQPFIESSLEKIAAIKDLLQGTGKWLQVDGGVDEHNIEKIASMGADTFVAGSAVFKQPDRNSAIQRLRALALACQGESQ
jgi:ribulose-phosphate 3-epimerase